MAHNNLVPALKSTQLLGPGLLSAKFRDAQTDLTIVVAHAPTSAATDDDRMDFYSPLSDVCVENEMDVPEHVTR